MRWHWLYVQSWNKFNYDLVPWKLDTLGNFKQLSSVKKQFDANLHFTFKAITSTCLYIQHFPLFLSEICHVSCIYRFRSINFLNLKLMTYICRTLVCLHRTLIWQKIHIAHARNIISAMLGVCYSTLWCFHRFAAKVLIGLFHILMYLCCKYITMWNGFTYWHVFARCIDLRQCDIKVAILSFSPSIVVSFLINIIINYIIVQTLAIWSMVHDMCAF